jgi:hypothetical protein
LDDGACAGRYRLRTADAMKMHNRIPIRLWNLIRTTVRRRQFRRRRWWWHSVSQSLQAPRSPSCLSTTTTRRAASTSPSSSDSQSEDVKESKSDDISTGRLWKFALCEC